MSEMFDPVKAKDILETTLSAVLAEMTFLDCIPAHNPTSAALAKMTHCVAIDALRPGSFRVELRVGEDFRKKIIGMLFDADQEPQNLSTEDDLLLEILNVLTGNFLTAYFGQEYSPKLELPRYLFFSDPAEGDIVVESIMDVEGDLLQLTLRSIRYRY